jgi:hypothetical protein
MRIALAATLAFVALWLVALRPKPVEEVAPAPMPTASTPLTERPAQAAEAVDKANAASAAHEAAAPDAAAAKPAAPPAEATAPATAAKSPAPAAKPSPSRAVRGAGAVLHDLDAGRTVVLLFWDRRAPDDRTARRAVARVERHHGKVRVHVAPIKQVGRYGRITQSVPVTQSPTVLVIGRDKKAQAITGLTVASEIDDKVRTVLRRAR